MMNAEPFRLNLTNTTRSRVCGWPSGSAGLRCLVVAAVSLVLPLGAGSRIHASPVVENLVTKGMFAEALDASASPAVTANVLPEYAGLPLTVELWCKLNGSGKYNILIANGPKESSNHWEMYADPAGMLCAYFPGRKPSELKTGANLADRRWHYVCMVLNSKNASLFVDGKREAAADLSEVAGGPVVAGPLCVGRVTAKTGNIGCDGAIDEVRVSNVVREIADVPASPFVPDAGTLGLWHFDRVDGAREFFDASSKRNPMGGQHAGPSKNELDRASYKAGPSTLDSPAKEIVLQKGAFVLLDPASVCMLSDGWRMVEGGEAAERLAGAWTKSLEAKVPGSVHADLMKAGVIPDPYIGRNQEIAREWSYKSYFYKKEFSRPPKGQDETLVFGGICNKCSIWLNGKKLGDHEGMFESLRYPVKNLLQDQNTLVVKLEPAIDWTKTVVFNNSYGWHYAKFPPLGIWRPVFVCGEPAMEMQSPFVATHDVDKGVVDLVTMLNGSERGGSGILAGVITPENFKGDAYHFTQEIEAGKGEKTVHLRFSVPDHKLWWPVDMGSPNLYRIRLAFTPKQGGRADVKEFCFGIRSVKMEPVNGCSRPELFNWTFVINGRPMFVKGSGWCTPDAMMDFSRARYDRYLSLSADQHVQMLRAWGSGMVETDDFYDLCDRKGIMVMQEWPTAWNSHLTQPFDMLERTVREGILRLRSHPSLTIFTGGNESNNPYGPAIDMMGRLCAELDGTREFHRGEAYGGSEHDYKIYWEDYPLDRCFSMKSVFYGEFGMASYPNYESVIRFLPDAEKKVWPPKDDGCFAYHTPVFNTMRDMGRITRLSRYFSAGESMERFIIGSQLAQAVGTRHPLERMRTLWPRSTGALYYKMNDNCPAASWSTVDWYGAPKISHYLIQDSFAPLVGVVLYEKGSSFGERLSLPVFLLDDAASLTDSSWEVVVRAYGADLALIRDQRYSGRGAVGKVKQLGEFTLEANQTKTSPLLVVIDVRKNGDLAQRNYHFTNFEPAPDCLFKLPKGSVSARISGDAVVVENTGRVPLVAVDIRRPGHLDTFTLEDNCFWLDAGESKTVKASSTDGLTVCAWNLEKPVTAERAGK